MNKALNENAELKKRIGTEEINKSKLNEIINNRRKSSIQDTLIKTYSTATYPKTPAITAMSKETGFAL